MLSRDTKIALVIFFVLAPAVLSLIFISWHPSHFWAKDDGLALEGNEWVTATGEGYTAAQKAAQQGNSIVGCVLDGDTYTPDERHCGWLYVAESAPIPPSGYPVDLTVWLVSIHKDDVAEFKPADLLGSLVRLTGTLGEQENDGELKRATVVRFDHASWMVLKAGALSASERLALLARLK